jgi:uncharacterized membrane protein YdfJ with MMPL/SSD domain
MIGEILEMIAEIGTWVMPWRAFLWTVLISLILFTVFRLVRGSSVPLAVIIGTVGIAAGLVWDWRRGRIPK